MTMAQTPPPSKAPDTADTPPDSGTPPEQAAASSAITCRRSPRLARNLAMAMALEQQNRQQQMMLQMRRQQRMAAGGPYGDGAEGQ